MKIRAFTALRPPASLAERVAAVPYDVVEEDEARALAAGNPFSFLHVTRPEVNFPPGAAVSAAELYAKAAERFAGFQAEGLLEREAGAHVYIYRLEAGGRCQTGIVACCRVEDYERGVIRRHESTRLEKEEDRARHIEAVGAHAGPVFLAYRERRDIDELVAVGATGPPLFRFTASDGVGHTVWRVAQGEGLAAAFDAVPVGYVADGHHRAAAAARVAAARRAAAARHTGDEEYDWFLAVLFPTRDLRLYPIHRLVSGLNGRQSEDFLQAVSRACRVTEGRPGVPRRPRTATLYLAGRWHELTWEAADGSDPVAALDVSVLQDRILEPILGIHDPRTDPRIAFLAGGQGAREAQARVDAGRASAAFCMFPTTVAQMMAVADAGRTMPPKSTWFAPKPRSGLLVHTL